MRPWLEISDRALAANARAISLRVAPARLCAVVKSNAYGHGLIASARAFLTAGVPDLTFGVFNAAEAITLRDAGISAPLVLFGPAVDADLEPLARANVELAVLDMADVERLGRTRAFVHLKVETGTHRFGLRADQVAAAASELRDAGATIAGVYSHLANAEELDFAFTREQLARLLDAVEMVGPSVAPNATDMQRTRDDLPRRHIAASAAALLWPEFRLDMVRCGLAMYGFWPSDDVRKRMHKIEPSFALEPALRWFAPVIHVTDVAPGETVGYGREFTAKRDSRVAVLALGYADGLPRATGSGRGRVRFGKSYAPIVGRVCMNVCMVDVTEIAPSIRRGDAVEIDVEEIAAATDTIQYEILAQLPLDLERRRTQ